MGLLSRDVTLKHDDHEIAFAAHLGGSRFATCQYKLYVDGQVADTHEISVWAMFFGSAVTLRGQLPPLAGQSKPRRVKVVANLRVIRNNDYQFFVDDEQIHQVWATYGGV